VNTSVTTIFLSCNQIDKLGALALAYALKVNTSLTSIDLVSNRIGIAGAAALVDALQVNTSLTYLDRRANGIGKSNRASFDLLIARNKRFLSLFLFDARRMLLSLMCADECGVVWPYLLERGDTDGKVAPDNIEAIRAEFSGVVAERRRRLHASAPEAKRRRLHE
jgi:hypothetical protein